MKSLSKYNRGVKYLLCEIDLFGKYVWVIPIKDKKGASIVNAFEKILSDSMELHSNRKPNKIWVDQGSEFYSKSFKDLLNINNIEIYSTYNEEKSVVAERFIRTLKNKIFKHMTAILKNVCLDVLDDIVDKYNDTVHRTVKMKPIEITDDYYAEHNGIAFTKIAIKKNLQFKVADIVRISKYKNIFAKGYTPNWSEEVSVIIKIKNTVPWSYAISNLNGEEITGSFYEKELEKTDQNKFRIEKALKRKGDKLYVKCKGFDNSLNSWINKKDLL